MRRARHRSIPALAAVALTIALATACAPEPAPAPSSTGFASEEEAFAAAEATYRAYVDALNEVDLSDPATFEPVYAWLTGDALREERKSLTSMHSNGWTVSGSSQVDDFNAIEADPLSALACLNVSAIDLVDKAGVSQVGAGRHDVYALALTFVTALGATATGLQISDSTAIKDSRCSTSP